MNLTTRQLVLNAIQGKPHPRIPVAQHNFPFCIRHCGSTMRKFRNDPVHAARVLADTAFEFGYDCIIIDFDTCTLAEAMGSKLVFPEDEPARVEHYGLATLEAGLELRIPDPHKDGRMPLWLETTRELRRIVGDDKAILARADQGPFGLLFQLRDSQELMMDLIEADEGLISGCLSICCEAGTRFAKAQLEAGADIVSIGDSASGESLISPDMYARFAQPFQRQYKQMLGGGLLSLHICGKTNNILEGMTQTGSDVLELDHLNDLSRSLPAIADRSCVFGNIDPSSILTLGNRQTVLDACKAVLQTAKRLTRRFVLCPGCLVNSTAPEENVRAMTEAAKRWGWREEDGNLCDLELPCHAAALSN